jgi:hypothetical protein
MHGIRENGGFRWLWVNPAIQTKLDASNH